ncbi:hypothetical protein [Sedimentitalea todarodis]|uniref:Uncharacterized protein n=1 Tax=Sedimentitalea todarodis TaxID=1631240 RepID=A0ABU3VIE3_9RHOB|nr:hypothetical protein [Sedimentitalea todarodis]MDU9005957.1 hypothetical protein [Sedimentitalea todarodis]
MTGLPDTFLADSVSKLGPDCVGRVVVTGSHGGIYAAYLACKADVRAAIFHDAGVGLDRAGIGGLDWLAAQGMAAAAVDHTSAAIGQATQVLGRGIISHANAPAAAHGVTAGMPCRAAGELLQAAEMPMGSCPEVREGRDEITPPQATRRLILVDSASLVVPDDAGHVIVTGSHGALFGSDPANALKADGYLALFNDAGGTATSRLPVLQDRSIAAATVAASSARIGEARSTWQDGIISALNDTAAASGARAGMPARDLIALALTQ